MVLKKPRKMKLRRYHCRPNATSYANYALLMGTAIVVLITSHANSAQFNDNNLPQTLVQQRNNSNNSTNAVKAPTATQHHLVDTYHDTHNVNDQNTATNDNAFAQIKGATYQQQEEEAENAQKTAKHQQQHDKNHHYQHHHEHEQLQYLSPDLTSNNDERRHSQHKHHSGASEQYKTIDNRNFRSTVRHPYHSKYTITELLHTKFERKLSNDIDMDPCKAGGFMGDIALPNVEYEDPIVAFTKIDDTDAMQADAPVLASTQPLKLNATFQRELEILKKEVYHEGLQVEEEGMTDIIRRKTKLASKSSGESMRHHNDPILSANEPVKPTFHTPPIRNLKSEIIGMPQQRYEQTKTIEFETAKPHNLINRVDASEPIEQPNLRTTEKIIKPVTLGLINRFVDQRKIQSDTKDIEYDSGNNFIQERKVIILPTEQPAQRSTLPNVYSNTGGNGMKFDEIEVIQPEKIIKRRHRRGRKHRQNSLEHSTRVQRLSEELNRPIREHRDFFKINNRKIDKELKAQHKHRQHRQQHYKQHQRRHRHRQHNGLVNRQHDHPQLTQLESPQNDKIMNIFNYSAENIDDMEIFKNHQTKLNMNMSMNITKDLPHKWLDTEMHNPHPEQSEKHHRTARAVTAKKERVWDYGVIPFEIDGNFSGSHKALFKTAMRHWENFTCIKFVERDPETHPNYIVFTVRSCGCCSFVGKRGNGPQAISIGRNCDKFGIIVHELGHVVGFWHEHTRPDREKHVVIEHNNIMKGQDYNFNMLTPDEVNSLGMPYDYDSIMHYARNTFSKGTYLDTILPKEVKGKKRPEIGQRLRLSAGDIAQANLLYKCPMCGRTFQDNTGIFASPSYYTAGALTNETEQCEWRITATHGERVVLRLESLNIFDDCQTDYLEIRDGYYYKSPLIKRFCGEVSNEVVTTVSSRMLLTFVNTHRAEGFRGFKAEYEVICGGELTIDDNEGRLESPNYPLEYLSNKECVWKITVPKGYQVALKFQSFEVENHDSCVYDYVEVREGPEQDSQLIGVFCGYKPPPNMKSTGNSMYVKFVSDSSVQKAGFSAIFMKEVDECETQNHGCEHECINTLGGYECSCHIGFELHSNKKNCEDACGGRIEYPNGTITSPSFPDMYPVLKECIWEIVAPENHKISLNFTHFDLEGIGNQQSDCGYDSVMIYSKLDQNRLKRIGTYCGSNLPPTATSESNALRIEFHSDKSIQRSGFAAVFFTDIDECATNNGGCQHECQNTIGSYMCSCHNGYSLHENGHDCKEGECKHEITAPFGNIYSPNYPDSYPPNADCVWHFSTTPGHRIKLIFNEFHVESHQECAYDNIAIYDGDSESSSILGRFCGDKIPYPISSSTNQLYMVLKTDKNKQMSGFAAMHSTSCGGYLRATSQIQQFYSHARFGNKDYNEMMDCEWTIQAPSSSNVQLTFLTFDIEQSDNCTYDYVQVISGMEDASGPMYGQYCGTDIPLDIISLTDSLLVRFKTDDTVTMKGFSASYVAVDPFENSEEEEEEESSVYSSETATPFPGSLKKIVIEETEEDNYSDISENQLAVNSEYRSRNRYSN